MNAAWGPVERFRPSSAVRRMRLDGRSLIFCERRQQLFELNPAADLIWDALLEAPSPRAARLLSQAPRADPDQAQHQVAGQLSQWLSAGLWEPVDHGPDPAADSILRLAVARTRAEILCGDSWTLARLAAVFGHFPPFAGAPTVRLRITAWSGGFHLFEGGRYVGAFADEEVAPQVKALLTEHVVGRSFDGFFAHGALLARGRTLAVLAGPPGAGKSTLALALRAAGWTLCADDLIRVDRAARFHGVPFAPAVKEGAWALLQHRLPELRQQPMELRSDGQKVRYLPIGRPVLRPRPPDLFVALAREAGAGARADPVHPVEAVAALLGEAFSSRGRISADLMARLAERFQTVSCRRLVYSDLDEAVAAVEALGREL